MRKKLCAMRKGKKRGMKEIFVFSSSRFKCGTIRERIKVSPQEERLRFVTLDEVRDEEEELNSE